MNKSTSLPTDINKIDTPPVIKTSNSLDNLDKIDNSFIYEDIFEGDGPFGIIFAVNKSKIIVKKIIKNTAFDEYYKLKQDLELIEINNQSIKTMEIEYINKYTNDYWNEKSNIKLKFKKNIIYEISTILNKYNIYKFYDKFIELGVKSIDDFSYVELQDLLNMKMTSVDIQNFKTLNDSLDSR